jgi:two-component system CheB/CheR fusion protein
MPRVFVVVFEELEPNCPENVLVKPATEGSLAKDLEEELDRLKAQFHDAMEKHDASDEEMKASNEELQAMNEELRAASEELEISREELQSINEELITVNQELKSKVDELGRANSDLQNLMASTNIATVFLDRSACIKRYTPAAVALFSLIPSDVGRPLADLRHQLKYDSLVADAQRVIEQLGLIEREVCSAEGKWFLVRLLPSRTIEDQIAGLVLTFVDITERKQAEELLQVSEARFRSLVSQSTVGIAQSDVTGNFTYVNERYCELTGRKPEKLLNGLGMRDITHPDDRARYAALLEKMFTAGEAFVIQKRYMRVNGSDVWVLDNVTPILDARDHVIGGTAASIDITERKQARDFRQRHGN